MDWLSDARFSVGRAPSSLLALSAVSAPRPFSTALTQSTQRTTAGRLFFHKTSRLCGLSVISAVSALKRIAR